MQGVEVVAQPPRHAHARRRLEHRRARPERVRGRARRAGRAAVVCEREALEPQQRVEVDGGGRRRGLWPAAAGGGRVVVVVAVASPVLLAPGAVAVAVAVAVALEQERGGEGGAVEGAAREVVRDGEHLLFHFLCFFSRVFGGGQCVMRVEPFGGSGGSPRCSPGAT